MKRQNGKKELYLPRLLEQIRRETGLTMMAVCSGGAGLHEVGNWSARFAELLERVPEGLTLLISVVCGNDWYAWQNIQPLGQDVVFASTALCEGMKAKGGRRWCRLDT